MDAVHNEFYENINWTLDKGLACLKRVIPEDLLPSLSDKEKKKYVDLVEFKNDKMRTLLIELLIESDGRIAMFGLPEEILFDMSYFARLLENSDWPPKNDESPVVRYFQNDSARFMLSQEVDSALKIAFNRRHPSKKYPDFFLHMETAEERKRGIVYSVCKDGFTMMLSILDLSEDDIKVVTCNFPTNFQHVSFPIVSSYGTQCYLATDGFHDILNYLINVLAVFRGVKQDDLPKVWKWIESLEQVFVPGKTLYLIETKKIDELIDRARKELKVLITEPIYYIPFKPSYTKKEVFIEIKNLMRNFTMDAKLFETFYVHMTTDSGGQPLTVKYVYEIYYQFMRYKVQNVNKKLENFLITQLSFVNTEHVDSSSNFQRNYVPYETGLRIEKMNLNTPKNEAEKEKENKPEFSGMKKGFLIKNTANVEEKNNNEKKLEFEKKDKEIGELKRQLAVNMQKSKIVESELRTELDESRQSLERCENYFLQMQVNAETREIEMKVNSQREIVVLTAKLENRERELEIIKNERKEQAEKYSECLATMKTFSENAKTVEATLKETIKNLELKLLENENSKSELVEKLRKKEDFEEWLADGFKKFGRSENEMCSKVRERLEKYQKFLSVDYDDLIDLLSSNLQRLTRLHPKSIEMISAKSEVLEFDKNHDDFMKKVRAEIRKIQNNPAISFEELGEELDEFPDEKFMKNYNKWVRENNLE